MGLAQVSPNTFTYVTISTIGHEYVTFHIPALNILNKVHCTTRMSLLKLDDMVSVQEQNEKKSKGLILNHNKNLAAITSEMHTL